jgi:hypothetical protein
VTLAIDWIGTLPAWLTIAALIGTAVMFARGGGGIALGQLRTANRVLAERVRELEESDTTKQRKIAELEGRTNVALALVPVLEWTTNHEARAQERQAALLGVLGLIAERLGPDDDRHDV